MSEHDDNGHESQAAKKANSRPRTEGAISKQPHTTNIIYKRTKQQSAMTILLRRPELGSFLITIIAASVVVAVKVGDTIPAGVDLHYGFPPEKIDLEQRLANKRVILLGLPGAFTPT